VEFDNLYLDMNGIIHPCCHPEDSEQPESEDEMMVKIMEYIDRLFGMIRPRKVLFMAIDGVAPRAKMNQQRSRRYRAAREIQQKRAVQAEVYAELGLEVPESKETFDSNVITPGTLFMKKVADTLRYYVVMRLNSDPGWAGVKVILSDASDPGEGEHKIMEFIRKQRMTPGYNPNTVHALYGLDADLIMLGLATHELNFYVLRELVVFKNTPFCGICRQNGHYADSCAGKLMTKSDLAAEAAGSSYVNGKKPFQLLSIAVLREYLSQEFQDVANTINFNYSLERVLDDWVMLCFFVGNDFLPHMPTLEIREGAISKLMEVYRRMLPRVGGYLTDSGTISFQRLERILQELALMEDGVFQRRKDKEMKRRHRDSASRRRVRELLEQEANRDEAPEGAETLGELFDLSQPQPPRGKRSRNDNDHGASALENGRAKRGRSEPGNSAEGGKKPELEPVLEQEKPVMEEEENDDPKENEQEVEEKPSGNEAASLDGAKADIVGSSGPSDPEETEVDAEVEAEAEVGESAAAELVAKRIALKEGRPVKGQLVLDDEEEMEDGIRFHESGWRDRYYDAKFGAGASQDPELRKDVVKKYLEGLQWVLLYYYQGVPSWSWYYPYHYTPFCSDMQDISDFRPVFVLGEPFLPFQQLMAVLPPFSNQFVPLSYRTLMESTSEIAEFFPLDFPIDLNGKKFEWQGVALLPWIDEERLKAAIKTVDDSLSEEESARNRHGPCFLLVRSTCPLARIISLLKAGKQLEAAIPAGSSHGVYGRLLIAPGEKRLPLGGRVRSPLGEPVAEQVPPDLNGNQVMVCCFVNPDYPTAAGYVAKVLDNAVAPPPVLVGQGRGRGGRRGGGDWQVMQRAPIPSTYQSNIHNTYSFGPGGNNRQQQHSQPSQQHSQQHSQHYYRNDPARGQYPPRQGRGGYQGYGYAPSHPAQPYDQNPYAHSEHARPAHYSQPPNATGNGNRNRNRNSHPLYNQPPYQSNDYQQPGQHGNYPNPNPNPYPYPYNYSQQGSGLGGYPPYQGGSQQPYLQPYDDVRQQESPYQTGQQQQQPPAQPYYQQQHSSRGSYDPYQR
jgi:5'-3' exoribonuclease 2